MSGVRCPRNTQPQRGWIMIIPKCWSDFTLVLKEIYITFESFRQLLQSPFFSLSVLFFLNEKSTKKIKSDSIVFGFYELLKLIIPNLKQYCYASWGLSKSLGLTRLQTFNFHVYVLKSTLYFTPHPTLYSGWKPSWFNPRHRLGDNDVWYMRIEWVTKS